MLEKQNLSLLFEVKKQQLDVAREIMRLRNPALLESKIVGYMREQGFANREVQAAHQEQLPVLTELFGTPDEGLKTDYVYHGTGLYSYAQEKYQTNPYTAERNQVVPILENILTNGLQPKFDPWVPTGDMRTISLAQNYLYAKWFAAKYMSEAMQLQWQFGDPTDWFFFSMADTMRDELGQVLTGEKTLDRQILREQKNKRQSAMPYKLQSWIGNLRHLEGNTSLKDILTGHSDILNNWGSVLCIPKDQLQRIEMSFGGTHELRTDSAVTPEQIAAIGVPLDHLAQAQKVLQDTGSTAQLFALECADLHLASFDFNQLVQRVFGA